MSKLWKKESSNIPEIIEKFCNEDDRKMDSRLAIIDIKLNKVYSRMLMNQRILSFEEFKIIEKGYQELEIKYSQKQEIEDKFEDIHSKIEFDLIEIIGDLGKKIHAGKSRNDQIITLLKIYYQEELSQINTILYSISEKALKKAFQYEKTLIPGYTHTQIAMPSSGGLWFGGFAEGLIEEIKKINLFLPTINQSPLGSAAGYGSSFNINREEIAKELNFEEINISSNYAQFSRQKTDKTIAFIIASISENINKFCSDIILFNSQNFNIIGLSEEYTTGSSIMPHKKNPDVFELIRARSNSLISIQNQINQIYTNLIGGYHRDFQIIKSIIFNALDGLKNILELMNDAVEKIQINENILENPLYKNLFSVDLVNKYCEEGMSFRDAYIRVSQEIINGNFEINFNWDKYQHTGSIGNPGLELIQERLNKIGR